VRCAEHFSMGHLGAFWGIDRKTPANHSKKGMDGRRPRSSSAYSIVKEHAGINPADAKPRRFRAPTYILTKRICSSKQKVRNRRAQRPVAFQNVLVRFRDQIVRRESESAPRNALLRYRGTSAGLSSSIFSWTGSQSNQTSPRAALQHHFIA